MIIVQIKLNCIFLRCHCIATQKSQGIRSKNGFCVYPLSPCCPLLPPLVIWHGCEARAHGQIYLHLLKPAVKHFGISVILQSTLYFKGFSRNYFLGRVGPPQSGPSNKEKKSEDASQTIQLPSADGKKQIKERPHSCCRCAA
jgi:hypothetical protein